MSIFGFSYRDPISASVAEDMIFFTMRKEANIYPWSIVLSSILPCRSLPSIMINMMHLYVCGGPYCCWYTSILNLDMFHSSLSVV